MIEIARILLREALSIVRREAENKRTYPHVRKSEKEMMKLVLMRLGNRWCRGIILAELAISPPGVRTKHKRSSNDKGGVKRGGEASPALRSW